LRPHVADNTRPPEEAVDVRTPAASRADKSIGTHLMFDRLRQDYWLYKRNPLERALWAMTLYRFGQWVAEFRFKPLRWLGGKAYGLCFAFSPWVTGVFLDRRTRIGKRFHIVHPGMIVIHPDAVFGDGCGVMHGVTIGVNMRGGVPRIGNNVFIGAHATVLGEITIGDGARIAANSLVCSDVPPGALAMGVPAKIYPNMANLDESPKAEPATVTARQRATAFRRVSAAN
jgi:serine O-acetyltransferase